MLEIYNYNAGKGDCLRLHFTGDSGQNRNVIIDSGVTSFGLRFRDICEDIRELGEPIDALIITHVDEDHLGGLLWNLRNCSCRSQRYFREQFPIKEVWMNHGEVMGSTALLSVKQCDEVFTRLSEANVEVKSAVQGITYDIDGLKFNILWPTEDIVAKVHKAKADACRPSLLGRHSDYDYTLDELMDKVLPCSDSNLHNRASIIFETCIEGKKFLFTGDAWPKDILNVCGCSYDMIKLSHHGSARNISEEWAEKIQCGNYIISTDGIEHPDKQTIAKILKWNETVSFFVSSDWWREMLKSKDAIYKPKLHFAEGEKILWME